MRRELIATAATVAGCVLWGALTGRLIADRGASVPACFAGCAVIWAAVFWWKGR